MHQRMRHGEGKPAARSPLVRINMASTKNLWTSLRPARGAERLVQLFLIVIAAIVVELFPVRAALPEPEWQEPGVVYYRDLNPRVPLAVHVVKIDRARKDLALHTTLGGHRRIGMATLPEQATFIESEAGQAVAAINGDYFFTQRPFTGTPMNLQILRGGELVSGPAPDRAFFHLDAQGVPHITNATAQFLVTWPDGKTTPFELNQAPLPGQAVLFTAVAGESTRVDGIDLILEPSGHGPWLPLRIGQTLAAKVRRVNSKGFSPVTADTMVLSLSPRMMKNLPPLKAGLELKLSTATTPDLTGAQLAIGGGPTLVRGGKARDPEDFPGWEVRHPRSAFGWNATHYFFVQVDGRQPTYSMGMSLPELAGYFVQLGCDYAMNLDGGGSCTTWVAGKIVNNPSSKKERPSANALVLVRKPATGK